MLGIEGLVVNSDEFLQHWARGALTLDLASAYVLCPLNHLVLGFMAWNRGWVNERRSGGILDHRCQRGLVGSEGRN